MTEEQLTGTLHNHMVIWLHNSPRASDLKSKLEDQTFRQNLIDYLEHIIKQGYIDENLNLDKNVTIEDNVDVSDVSCKDAIHPA